MATVEKTIQSKKNELNLHNEVKWQKISATYRQKYIDLINCFFDLIEQDLVKIRIMFTQNIHIPQNLGAYHHEFKYFLLYYQFIKHAFGLVYANATPDFIRVRLILDQLPDTREKVQSFREHLVSLNKNPQFQFARIRFAADQIADVNSHDHVILQCLDIVLGSMQFRLNDKHKLKPVGSKTRGKRTIAKESVYKVINSRIREIYPNFNIGISTSVRGAQTSKWTDRYRHWRFTPKGAEVDLTRGKKK